MQKLEKILEEIEENTIEQFNRIKMISAKEVEEILRKHMNDGWIPRTAAKGDASGCRAMQKLWMQDDHI